MNSDYIPIGTKVKVRRITGEEVEGLVVLGPLEYLLKIGEFCIIGKRVPGNGENIPWYCGRGRRSKARQKYEAQAGEIGMYEREKITIANDKEGRRWK